MILRPKVAVLVFFHLLVLHASLLVLLVISELCWPVKLRSTSFALKFSILSVSSKMVLKMPLGYESLTANLALVVSLSHVWFHMNVKIPFLSKVAVANLTREWLYAEVLSDMNVQSGLLGVADIAEIALEGLLFWMVYHVSLQVTFGNEGEATVRIGTQKWSLICLNIIFRKTVYVRESEYESLDSLNVWKISSIDRKGRPWVNYHHL